MIQFIKIILGLILGILFSIFIDHNFNTIIKGPNSTEIQSQIFYADGYCYKMQAYPVLSRGEHI